MLLQQPTVIYTAQTDEEAQTVCLLLTEAGIRAFTTEDLSRAGLSVVSMMPGSEHPNVWIDHADAERSVQVLQTHGKDCLVPPLTSAALPSGPVEAVCEECGKPSTFPGEQR